MERPVVFKNKRGKQLMGILHIPKGKKKWPLVVICHGFGKSKTRRMFTRVARALEKNKIATLRFDFEGCGDSEGEFRGVTVERQASNLGIVMDWILRQKNINRNKVVFIGESFGAVIVTVYISQNRFFPKTLVFWAPAFNFQKLISIWHTKSDLRKWRKQKYFVKKEKIIGISYLKENQNQDYTSLLSKIKIPILIIHGKKDEVVPIKFSKKLAKDYKNIKLKIYPKTDHGFEDYYIHQKLVRDTVKWFKKYLSK